MQRRTLIRLAPFGLWALLVLVQDDEPFRWGHRLTEACSWRAGPVAGLFGAHEPDAAALRAQARCWARRGARDPEALPVLKVFLPRWPTQAELAAWENADEDRDPLPAR